MASLATPYLPTSPSTHDLKEKHHRWASAWTAISSEERAILSSLHAVEISYFAGPGFQEFEPGKVVMIPTVAFMLYWYVEEDRRMKHQFNFAEAYEKGRCDGGKSGVFLKSQAEPFVLQLNRRDLEYKNIAVFKFEEEELWIKFHHEDESNAWQNAFTSLIKSYLHPLDSQIPSREISESSNSAPNLSHSALRNTLGLLFDISTCQKQGDRTSHAGWTTLKVTYLKVDSETQEEYYVFDRSQARLEENCIDILTRVGEKLDPGNLATLDLYLKEFSLIEYEKRKKCEGHEEQGWVCRGLGKPEMMVLWVSDFLYVMQQYRKCDSIALKQSLVRKCSEIQKKPTSPIDHFFDVASAYCLSVKLQLTALSQTKPVVSEAIHASSEQLPVSANPKLRSKWYKESCECRLF